MSEQRLREVAPRKDFRRGRCCFLCHNPYNLQLAHSSPDGAETWMCKDTPACAARMIKRDGFKADWVCYHADKAERLTTRPATDLTWYEWHQARGESDRAARHGPGKGSVTEK